MRHSNKSSHTSNIVWNMIYTFMCTVDFLAFEIQTFFFGKTILVKRPLKKVREAPRVMTFHIFDMTKMFKN